VVLSEVVFLTTLTTLAVTHCWYLRVLLMLDRAYDFARSTYRSLRREVRNVTLLWRQGRPTAGGEIIFSVLLTSYDVLFFLFPSIRYSVHTFIYFFL